MKGLAELFEIGDSNYFTSFLAITGKPGRSRNW